MRFGSLFAGIGGIDLGLERAGMECAWQVEIDDYCTRVLEKHWPDVPRYGDIRGLTPPAVDLIAGGFPCQPHSVAGKRGGAEDDRNLWPEFNRVISELKPRFVLAENVPGIVSTYLEQVIFDLESQGFRTVTLVLPAIALSAPHRRDRVFVVAYANSERLEGRIQGTEHRLLSTDNISLQPLWERWTHGLPEPLIRRGDDGFSNRMDRLRGLGNAVVPQVAEWVGRRIMEFDGN